MEEPAELTEEALEQAWSAWKKEFKKKYDDEEEENYRKGLFFKNVKMVKEHNEKYRQKLVTYTMGINQFADFAEDEDPCGHGGKKRSCCT